MFKKVKSLNTKKMDKIVEIISKENHKSKLFIKFDMLVNFLIYGTGYTDYFRGNFINLTKENDSPVFAKKLLDNNEFVDDLEFFKNLDNLNAESGQNKVLAFILFNYLSTNLSIFKNNNIQIQENTPYWSFNISVGGNNGYNTICILPVDKNIRKNAIEFINMNNNN